MREKQERFVVTFATTTGAMAMERACRDAGLPGRLIPVPRSITAGCGMCWSAPPDARQGGLPDPEMFSGITPADAPVRNTWVVTFAKAPPVQPGVRCRKI